MKYSMPRGIWDEVLGTYGHESVPGPIEKGRSVIYDLAPDQWHHILEMSLAYAEPNLQDAEGKSERDKLRRCVKWLQAARAELLKNMCTCKHADFMHEDGGPCEAVEVPLKGPEVPCECKGFTPVKRTSSPS